MMSKKKIMYGIYGVLFGVFILIGTYAWLTWKSKETALVLTIGNINNIQITLKPYVIDDELLPVLSYESGVSTNVDVVNNSSVKKKFRLYYKINDIAEELIDEAFKYTITRSVDSGNTYEVYKEGNFVGTASNSNLEILEETIVKNDNYKYKVYLWLDGDGNSQGNVQGKVFSGELRAEFLEDPKDIMIDLPDGMIPITFDTSNNSTVVKTVYSSRIEDLSGNGTISKINGAMYDENGLVFDGVDDSVLLPEYSLSTMNNGFTFEVMIDANSVTTTDTSEEMYLIGNCEVGGSALLIKNGVFRMYVYDETNSKYVIASSSKILVPNKKYLLTGIFDGENIKIYINGKLVTTTVFSGTMKDTSSSTHFFLGCNPKGSNCDNSYYNGVMYEARMYDRALTDKEVSDNYNGNITSSNLLFSFDFKNKNTWYDYSNKEWANAVLVKNNSTTTKAFDLSNNNTDNTINGATYSDGGLLFDGVDDSVLLPEYTLSSMSNGFTFEVLINVNEAMANNTTGEVYLLGNCEGGGAGLVLINKAVARMYVYNATSSKYFNVTASKSLEVDKDYLLTGVFDGQNIKLYIDGKLVATKAFSGTMKDTNSSTHFFLGCNPKGTDCQNSYYNGIMHEARMYDRALTDKEVSNNYNGNITSSNLLFSFDFKDSSREEYKNNKGVIIPEDDILAYYVYVPRYEYKIWETGKSATGKEQEIEINLQNKYDNKSNGTQVGEYLTHPAFTFGDTELNGIWVGKFETTGTADSPTIKPNVTSLRNQNVATQFQTSLKFSGGTLSESNVTFNGNDIYGLNNKTDSHMMKNSEWGAAAYLSHSKYGKNEEIRINNYYNAGTLTGCGASTANKSSSNTCEIVYGVATEYPQSTTGNISGIFDMSGGNYEYVMGVFANSDGQLWSGNSASDNSGFTGLIGSTGDQYTGATFPNSKYYDIYKASSGITIDVLTACDGGICYGHALSETNKWYKDDAIFISAAGPWLRRGGFCSDDAFAGAFYFDSYSGKTGSAGFRSVITSN